MESGVKILTKNSELEAKVDIRSGSIGLVMCHPHPLYGGTMNNKVVTTVVRSARDLGLSTLRFNFRGIGESTGEYDNGVGEQEDVLAALNYAREELGWETVILAGFSFGAGMACLTACQFPNLVNGLFLLAPAVHHFDAPVTMPYEFDTWVLMGDADEVVPFEEVESWVNRLIPQPHWLVFKETSHFFHGRLTDLKEVMSQELQSLLDSQA